MLEQETQKLKREKSDKKKYTIDAEGNKTLFTENGQQSGRVSPTKLTEMSEEACCKICWGTEAEDRDNLVDEEDEPNPLISPCKCTGT
mgnify:CR=1 FL=1